MSDPSRNDPQSRLQRQRDLFDGALQQSAEARDAWLAAECADDSALLAEVRALLAADAGLADHTARPIVGDLSNLLDSAATEPTLDGTRVGPYLLRAPLGRGGMGVVWRGERVDGSVAQQVAIKLLRRDALSDESRRRFQVERQTLAGLSHPNIARLYDSGELADGTPYFVMELIDGTPVTEYCAQRRMPLGERVALVRTICAAVLHAHRNLVVHRDLKPSNILVGRDGQPKLLDFGIAKPLGPDALPATAEQTGTAQRYFSPQYAAPEQMLGGPIGVGCDVYALGLLLYELLSGTRPFDLAGLSAGQVEQLVTTVVPEPPSAAAARAGAAGVTATDLRGDLDGIVQRCLRKAPEERYASVEQLDADLANYLDGRPVVARGGHRWYRLQKFVRRNAVTVGASALVMIAVVLGASAFAWQAAQTRKRAAELEQVAKFQSEMLSGVDPTRAGLLLHDDIREKLKLALAKDPMSDAEREAQLQAVDTLFQRVNPTDAALALIDSSILTPARKSIDKQFADQPLLAATLRYNLGNRYDLLGLYDSSIELLQSSLESRRRLLGPDHPDTIENEEQIALVMGENGKSDEALAMMQEVVERRARVFGEHHPLTIRGRENIGVLLVNLGRMKEAEVIQRGTLEERRRLLGNDDIDTMTSLNNLGDTLRISGRYAEAKPLLEEALEIAKRHSDPDDFNRLKIENNLGLVEFYLGNTERAVAIFTANLATRRRVLGAGHPATLNVLNNLALAQMDMNDYEATEANYREALRQRLRSLGPAHPEYGKSESSIGNVLAVTGRLDEALSHNRSSVEVVQKALGRDHPETLLTRNNLCNNLVQMGRLDEADADCVAVLATRRAKLGDESPSTLRSVLAVGRLRLRQGRTADAIALLEPTEPAFRKVFAGDKRSVLASCLTLLGGAYRQKGDFESAEKRLSEADQITSGLRSVTPVSRRELRVEQVLLYQAWNRADPAHGHAADEERWRAALEKDRADRPMPELRWDAVD